MATYDDVPDEILQKHVIPKSSMPRTDSWCSHASTVERARWASRPTNLRRRFHKLRGAASVGAGQRLSLGARG